VRSNTKVMVAKPTRLTHKVAIQLLLVAENCTICSSHFRRPVWKLLDTPSYTRVHIPACKKSFYTHSEHKVSMHMGCKKLIYRCEVF